MRRALKFFALAVLTLLLAALVIAAFLLYREVETSTYQARHLARLADELRWEIESGPNNGPHFSARGPYDIRMGYSRLPDLVQHLAGYGFEVRAQARVSTRTKELVEQGLFIPYREKAQAGLEVVAGNAQPLYRAVFPARVYENFEAVPPLATDSLLFIENRELLDAAYPKKNPAIEWNRLGKAVLDKVVQFFRAEHNVAGGSTLATQIEKYRHSPNGMTMSPRDKMQQIASASVRAYLQGEETLPVRKQIVLDYLNTVPLAAAPGFGEANGIGDGLWAWYGLDFDETNHILNSQFVEGDDLAEVAFFYKHVLSLMIAQRRPSYYLLNGRQELAELTDSHLRVLAQAGVIAPSLRDAALGLPLRFRDTAAHGETRDFSAQKAVNAVRMQLASSLGLRRLYDLDRLDLSVQSTLDAELQQKITETLQRLKDPEFAQAIGLYGHRLLGTEDPGKIIYSFTLSELTPQGVEFRILADNFDQPLDINKGTKLDLGSTAKLRTLVTYLEIIEALHAKYATLDPKALRNQEPDPKDVLSRWAIGYFLKSTDKSLGAILEAALERKYSANSGERFFTGGGLHVFRNFKREDDRKIMSVREATMHSVNLVYIRMMRDIVRYYMFQGTGASARILRDAKDSGRTEYLRRFADKEGTEFIRRFYLKYKNKTTPDAIGEVFFDSFRHTPRRLAAAHRYIYPESTFTQFEEFMAPYLPGFKGVTPTRLRSLYENYAPGKYSLTDQGYIATVHPLELWLARYLIANPRAPYKDVIEASGEERVAVYNWLFKTINKNSQDIRIRGLLELEAFLEIHRNWKRLGYPFDSLVPSLATAIGSSADHPAALAELMGIILNDGVRMPAVLIKSLRFAAGTPFETIVERAPVQGERIFSPELAVAVRGVLTGVVEKGTASRLGQAIAGEEGTQILIGGKTGTGDHRHVTFSSPGVMKESRAVNRSATFVFFIGERFFGTMTAFVPGADAENYTFTSALSTQVMKHLLPILRPLIEKAQPLSVQNLVNAPHERNMQEEKNEKQGANSS
ncbi:MAG: transglycosylase domain-containing protein [Nitrosospira sp.]|nr:transglycosylase domain-containing protein [Nitrosospira sp.]